MNFLRGIRAWFLKPSVRWGTGVLLGVGVVGGIIFWGALHTAIEATNSLKFCTFCHEMSTPYEEYKQSIHYSNASGVRAICTDCHVPREWGPKMVTKAIALKDVWYKMTGKLATPELYEKHRADLAKVVWAKMEATDSRECRNCHSFEAMDFHAQRPESAKQMQIAAENGETCISCHKGIAHKMPDMSQGYKLMFEQLQENSAKQADKDDTLFTLTTKSFYLDKDEAKEGSKAAGKFLPGTRIDVLDRSGDVLKISLKGWQQDQVDRIIYALRGQRIFQATVGKTSTDAIKRLKTETDPDTELVWHQVELDAWVDKADLVSDEAALWGYAEEMYVASCAVCHSKPDAHHYLANQWIGVLKSMERFVSIDKEQFRFLQKYLQFNASDVKDHHE
ncbi:NapC/NirT family cytochrome c [uncultured Cohaesibacter sp.]|uniref:NapC/NirT family cytochrome c n=1 Tax=uncultured Cohaesibacter sp. TaxID=1002546 RepID=UPI0029302601|nr:NapC/NirT family cytochrome c [uncultured Cohaesibacter sp.]